MRLGVDASNIRDGGGLTHLFEMFNVAKPQEFGISQVIIWGGTSTLDKLKDQPWLKKVYEPLLDQSLPYRLYWQKFKLTKIARQQCDYLYAPGSSYGGSFRPFVTFSQNMLPFEKSERDRYAYSPEWLKFLLLRWEQGRTFRQANGVVFLTNYARTTISQSVTVQGKQKIIPYGLNRTFFATPRAQRPLNSYSQATPFKLLYVSKLELYKHHWHVVDAIGQLRHEGLPVTLDLIGSPERPALEKRLLDALNRVDPERTFIKHYGHIPYTDLPGLYHNADGFVFASSCENLPNILLEAMAAGLPIACAERGPMPEVLGDAGVYFDPEKPATIASAVRKLVQDHEWRERIANDAHERAKAYSWERCAQETFSFLAEVFAARQSSNVKPEFKDLHNLSRLENKAE